MEILLGVLSVCGLVISSYFTGVAYGWIRSDVRWIPAFCRMDEQTCATIVFTPQARVFGIPNSLLGQLFYVAMLGGAVGGLIEGPGLLADAYVAASAVTVGLGVYLSYSLWFVLRVACPLCFTSHGINVIIFAILLLGAW